MDTGSQMILDLILKKTPGTLTEEDRTFLMARRSYVTRQQFELLGVDLDAELAKRNPVEDQQPEALDVSAKPLSKMTKPELLAHAAKMGIAVPDEATNEQIRELLK